MIKTMPISQLYSIGKYSSKITLNDKYHPDGDRIMMQLFYNGVLISQENKDIDLYFTNATLNIGYIGIEEKYRGGTLKRLHANCISTLKKYDYKTVKLKPLSSVLTMWIYLGFSFSKKIEEIKTRYLLINYLKSLSIISEETIKEYDKIPLIEIVSNHKNVFKNKEFPLVVEKKLYYSYLYKEVA